MQYFSTAIDVLFEFDYIIKLKARKQLVGKATRQCTLLSWNTSSRLSCVSVGCLSDFSINSLPPPPPPLLRGAKLFHRKEGIINIYLWQIMFAQHTSTSSLFGAFSSEPKQRKLLGQYRQTWVTRDSHCLRLFQNIYTKDFSLRKKIYNIWLVPRVVLKFFLLLKKLP